VPTYRLTLEYEGTRYRGWQEQQNARSVAGELRRAIGETGVEIKDLGGAGRTDAGVHALAQAAHLRLAKGIEPEPFRRAVNDRLPPDIHILSLAPVGSNFHARHGAASRSYLYQVSRRRTALAKRFVWWVKSPLDTGRMEAAAALVAGRHDFRLFCERPAEQTSTLVIVERVELAVSGSLVLVRLVASHFLWKMVRRVVGTLVEVGNGRLSPAGFAALLAGEERPGRGGAGAGLPAEWTAPPSGLFLERVLYPGDPPLGPLVPAVPVAGEPAG
jgi:tRNA pseudouridine38-40 synthase